MPEPAPRPDGRRRPGPPAGLRPGPGLALAVWLGATIALAPTAAARQVAAGPTAPRPVVDVGGHNGEIRALAFADDGDGGTLLLSAGEDKVVHVWTLADGRPRRSRTLRPRIYRGAAGAIRAMALSAPDAEGQSLLAVGGFGVRSNRGEVTLFRFPGVDDPGTGDVAAVLPEGYRNPAASPGGPLGHFNAIADLEFRPGNRHLLASAGGDGTVRFWDLGRPDAPSTVAILRGNRAVADARELLEGDEAKVIGLAFSPDGARLLVCGGFLDPRVGVGTIRLWDVADPTVPRLLDERPNPPREGRNGGAVANPNCLAFSPDGRRAFVGQENGLLLRFDVTAAGLANPVTFATGDEQGPVEAVACAPGPAPGGPRLLTSIIEGAFPDKSAAPSLDCRIELRDADRPEARAVEVGRTRGRVRAVALTPDGRHAVFAGGHDQQIAFRPIAGAGPGPVLSGVGGAVWDVRWSADPLAVAFSRSRPGGQGGPTGGEYERFRLDGDFTEDIDRLGPLDGGAPAAPSGPIRSAWGGQLAVVPYDTYSLAVASPGYDPRRPDPALEWGGIRLDPDLDGRWWSYSVLALPAGPDGRRGEVVAVGCDLGVRIFGIPDRRGPCPMLRALEGHSGPVLALAPSPDGRWLATGSTDQTVRLWPLAEAARKATLGAGLRPLAADGRGLPWEVVTVPDGSFAAMAGFRPGDRILEAYRGRAPVTDATLLIEALPGERLDFKVGRAGEAEPLLLGTTRRDQPALSIFPGRDRQWIAWTESGYYQATVEGASHHLVWHRNHSAVVGDTDASPFDAYQGRFHRPAVLTRLIASGSLREALAEADTTTPPIFPGPRPPDAPEPPPPAQPDGPTPPAGPAVAAPVPPPLPEVWAMPMIAGGGTPSPDRVLRADGPQIRLQLRVTAPPEGLPIRSVGVSVDGTALPPIAVPPGARELDLTGDRAIVVPLAPGMQQITVDVEDEAGNGAPRGNPFVVSYEPPGPPEPRAWVVSLGVGRFAAEAIPDIPFAAHDAERVGAFLRTRAAEDGFGNPPPSLSVLRDEEATAEASWAALAAIRDASAAVASGDARRDSAFVFVNTHFVDLGDAAGAGAGLLGVDAQAGADGGDDARPGLIPAVRLAEELGGLVDLGCRVVLLLDAVHEQTPRPSRARALSDWIRVELLPRDVIVVLASNSGPSTVDSPAGLGAFALGLTNLYDDPDAIPPRLDGAGDRAVRSITDVKFGLGVTVGARLRRQQVGVFVPRTIDPRSPFFGPPIAPAVPVVAQGGG